MKNIIFCSTLELIKDNLKLFDSLEKRFNCKIKKISNFEYQTKIKNQDTKIIFTYKPIRDASYESSYRSWKEKGIILPPPTEEIIDKIEKGTILTFGICGGFNGTVNEIYLPTSVRKLYFDEGWLDNKKFIPESEILINNILINKIGGKNSRNLTTNKGLMPNHFENPKNLIEISKNLGKYFDTVEMELYEIAKNFNEYEIGALLISSDVLNNENLHMSNEKNHLDYEKYKRTILNTIEEVIK